MDKYEIHVFEGKKAIMKIVAYDQSSTMIRRMIKQASIGIGVASLRGSKDLSLKIFNTYRREYLEVETAKRFLESIDIDKLLKE